MRVGVATIQRGRHAHLRRQALAVAALEPDRYVVVSMDEDPGPVAEVLGEAAPGDAHFGEVASQAAALVHRPVPDGTPLPQAAARNAAIAALGAVDLAVLLDVDCIPGPRLLAAFARAADAAPGALLLGPVRYLQAGDPPGDRLDGPSVARAVASTARRDPADDEISAEPSPGAFWSLCFAVAPATHARIGGFDEAYAGYGAEDTDYAMRARRAGVALVWAGGARAFHQHHDSEVPPRRHLADIVANARRYHARWGAWPMEGWLAAFRDEGLIRWEGDVLAPAGPPAARADPAAAGRR